MGEAVQDRVLEKFQMILVNGLVFFHVIGKRPSDRFFVVIDIQHHRHDKDIVFHCFLVF